MWSVDLLSKARDPRPWRLGGRAHLERVTQAASVEESLDRGRDAVRSTAQGPLVPDAHLRWSTRKKSQDLKGLSAFTFLYP